jgi:hypothetical protein
VKVSKTKRAAKWRLATEVRGIHISSIPQQTLIGLFVSEANSDIEWSFTVGIPSIYISSQINRTLYLLRELAWGRVREL